MGYRLRKNGFGRSVRIWSNNMDSTRMPCAISMQKVRTAEGEVTGLLKPFNFKRRLFLFDENIV